MRTSLLSAILSLVLLSGPGAVAAQKPGKKPDPKAEPVPLNEIGGKKLEEWIADIPSKDPSKGQNALQTLLMFGPDRAAKAVPAILQELKKAAGKPPLDTGIRVNGTIALGAILGEMEKPAPGVIDDAVGVLKGFLSDGQAVVRYRAAEALGRLGPRAKGAIPDLIGAARDADTWEVRQAAVTALGSVGFREEGGPEPKVVSALCAALKDGAGLVRLSASQALFWLGPPTTPSSKTEATAALEAATQDAEPLVRITTHMALLGLKGKGNETHLNAVAKYLGDDDPILRMQAAEALGTVGLEAKAQIPRLIATLKDRDARVVGVVVWALERMGKAAVDAVPQLDKLAQDTRRPEQLRQRAIEAIVVIQGKQKGKGGP
jgi:hypothetical protein